MVRSVALAYFIYPSLLCRDTRAHSCSCSFLLSPSNSICYLILYVGSTSQIYFFLFREKLLLPCFQASLMHSFIFKTPEWFSHKWKNFILFCTLSWLDPVFHRSRPILCPWILGHIGISMSVNIVSCLQDSLIWVWGNVSVVFYPYSFVFHEL